jgi:hypothetical protein
MRADYFRGLCNAHATMGNGSRPPSVTTFLSRTVCVALLCLMACDDDSVARTTDEAPASDASVPRPRPTHSNVSPVESTDESVAPIDAGPEPTDVINGKDASAGPSMSESPGVDASISAIPTRGQDAASDVPSGEWRDAAAPVAMDEEALLARECGSPPAERTRGTPETWGAEPGVVEWFDTRVDGFDRVTVVWLQRTASGRSVWLRRFAPSGGWSAPLFVSDYLADNDPALAVASNRRGDLLLSWQQWIGEATNTRLVTVDGESLVFADLATERLYGEPYIDDLGNPYYGRFQSDGWIDYYDDEAGAWQTLPPVWTNDYSLYAHVIANERGGTFLLWQNQTELVAVEIAGSKVLNSWALGNTESGANGLQLVLVPPSDLVAVFKLGGMDWLYNDYSSEAGWVSADVASSTFDGNGFRNLRSTAPGNSAAKPNGDLAIATDGILTRLSKQWTHMPLLPLPEATHSVVNFGDTWVSRCLDTAVLSEDFPQMGNRVYLLTWSPPALELGAWQEVATQTSGTLKAQVVVDFVGRITVVWVGEFSGTLSALRFE